MLNYDDKKRILVILRTLVLIVSAGVIALISADAFRPHFHILSQGLYMRCQLPVCLVYLTDFFVNCIFSDNRRRYLAHNWLFFIISVPYSWLLSVSGVHPSGYWAYALHLMPTFRAVLALAIVVGFVSRDRIVSLCASYAIILVLSIYFASLVFFICEGHTNPGIKDYWSALWWVILQATTLGASFYAITTLGKAIAMIISVMGLLMFPLFTVSLTRMMRKYYNLLVNRP